MRVPGGRVGWVGWVPTANSEATRTYPLTENQTYYHERGRFVRLYVSLFLGAFVAGVAAVVALEIVPYIQSHGFTEKAILDVAIATAMIGVLAGTGMNEVVRRMGPGPTQVTIRPGDLTFRYPNGNEGTVCWETLRYPISIRKVVRGPAGRTTARAPELWFVLLHFPYKLSPIRLSEPALDAIVKSATESGCSITTLPRQTVGASYMDERRIVPIRST